MSPSNQIPSETTALLSDTRPAGQSGSAPTRGRFGCSHETLLIPVTLATSLGLGIPSTTLIELIRHAVCGLWNILHGDPDVLELGYPSPPEFCDAPEVARYFAIILAVLSIIESATLIAGLGVFNRIASHYGRKPALLLVLIPAIMSNSIIAGSQYMPDWLIGWVFLLGILCGYFSGPIPYLIDMYVVDVCEPENRTATLSKITGWVSLGNCISFFLGGAITTKTGDPATVFYIATVIHVAAFIYIAFFLPESFPEEKRNGLSCMCAEPPSDALATTTRFAALRIFEPLKLLIPSRRSDGTRNWRLFWCAAHTFLFTLADSYGQYAWLVLATSMYHLTPADTGLFYTVTSISSTICLMIIVPQLVCFLRPYYRRTTTPRFDAEEDAIKGEEPQSETSDHFHVHLAVVSCIVGALSSLGAAASTTIQALIPFACFLGFAYTRGPMIRSLAAGSVDPLLQGEVLAAIGMVTNAGSVLSPVVMGITLFATIGTTPLLMFCVQTAVVLVSSSLLFLVRDGDRYQKPQET